MDDARQIARELYELSLRLSRNRDYIRRITPLRTQYIYELPFKQTLNSISEISFTMAKKLANSKGKDKKKAEFKGFANIELTVEEKAEMKEWIRDVEAVQVELDEMAASLYKVTFQKSEATGGYQATAFAMDSASPNAGYILSAFAPHWWDALACLAYKHAIRCEGVWPVDPEEPGDVWG